MAGELGLANSFKERIYGPLQAYRGSDGQAGREISLEAFMQTRAINNEGGYGLVNNSGLPLTLEDIFNDIGRDPGMMTLDNLISLSGDVSYLAPEVVRQWIVDGLESAVSYLDLVNSTQQVGSLTVTSPWIKYEDTRAEDIGEGETIPVSTATWGSKTITLKKSAIALEVTDEVVLSCPLNLLGEYLSEVGQELAVKLFRNGVTTLINGDQTGGTDSCAVIGVTTPAALVYKDFLRAWARASRIGCRWNNMLTNEEQANVVLEIDEFKDQQGLGGRRVELDSNKIVPGAMLHRTTEQLTNNQTLLYDKRAMAYLVFRGLLVENQRIMMRQIEGTAASIISGFATLKRVRRVIIDKSVGFVANGSWPSYMVPREDA